MKLIGSDTSPYVRKVRVVMAEKKIEYQYEQQDVWAPDSPIQQSNPLGKVPCLIMDDGGAVFDSARVEVCCWEALADGLLDAAILIRLEYTQRDESQRSDRWILRQTGKIDAALEAMSTGLADKPWCCDAKYSLADIATGCALSYLDFRFPGIDWRSRHANLARIADKLLSRQPFVDTTPVVRP